MCAGSRLLLSVGVKERMEASIRSRSSTLSCSLRNQTFQTTYKREFALKRSSPIVGGIPFGQRFLIGCPFQLSDPVGDSLYAMDFTNQKNVPREPFFRLNTKRAHRPHPHKQFPHWPRRSVSSCDLTSEETKQALRNQLDSTYQVDYTGAPQGFHLPLAYDRIRPFWRDQAQHTLDSEYRNAYQNPSKTALHLGGRYSFSSRVPADAIVPQTLPVLQKKSLQSIYTHEISQKTPSELYIKEFVDSFDGPMSQ